MRFRSNSLLFFLGSSSTSSNKIFNRNPTFGPEGIPPTSITSLPHAYRDGIPHKLFHHKTEVAKFIGFSFGNSRTNAVAHANTNKIFHVLRADFPHKPSDR